MPFVFRRLRSWLHSILPRQHSAYSPPGSYVPGSKDQCLAMIDQPHANEQLHLAVVDHCSFYD